MLKLIFVGLLLILVIIIVLLWYLNNPSINSLLEKEILLLKEIFSKQSKERITKDDLKDLPFPIQRYLDYSGIIGKERVYNFKMSLSGLFRIDDNKPWLRTRTIQFNYLPTPTRLFIIRLYLFGILSMTGRDIYSDGKGYMIGTFMRLKQLFDERGTEFDIGEFVTFLNDVVLTCPAGILTLKDFLVWKEIDDHTVEVSLNDQCQTVSAKLYFDETGRLINFTTNDRFYDEKDKHGRTIYVQCLWSTPVDSYQEVDGLMLPHQVRAIWHKKSGDHCYAKFTLDKIEYNVSV